MPPSANRRDFGSGSLRLLLALAVVTSHLSAFEIGRPAVFLFFAISGYWIAKNLEMPELNRKLVKIFLVSRILRIAVPFFAAYLIAAACFAALGAGPLKLPGISLLGVASHGQDLLGVSWSLDIELQFYLIAPLIVIAWPSGRVLLAAVVLATVIGWYLQIMHGIWTALSYAPCFMAGMAAARMRLAVSRAQAHLSVAVFLLAGISAALMPATQAYLIRTAATPWPSDWFGMIWTALLLPYAIWLLTQPSSRADRARGDFSYAIYLIHWPVIALVRPYLWPLSPVDLCLVLAAILAASGLFFAAIDRPANRLRLKLVARLSAHPAAIDGQDRAMDIIRRA